MPIRNKSNVIVGVIMLILAVTFLIIIFTSKVSAQSVADATAEEIDQATNGGELAPTSIEIDTPQVFFEYYSLATVGGDKIVCWSLGFVVETTFIYGTNLRATPVTAVFTDTWVSIPQPYIKAETLRYQKWTK